MKTFFISIVLLVTFAANAQETDRLPSVERTVKVTDPFYREDQFYVGLTHSLFTQKPAGFKQRSISIGTSFGFLRDIPLNQKRTIAIAPGAGFAFYNFRQNFAVLNPATHDVVVDSNADKNIQNLSYVEIPLELRWRSSKVYTHKFWRIYAGIKYSYLLNSKSKYEGYYGKATIKNSNLLSQSNLGVYMSVGFNTWNLYAYYGFKPLYDKGTANPNEPYLNMINLGLMFYIL